jgi:hypothetical protein
MSDDDSLPPAGDDAGGGVTPSREDREGATSLLNFFHKKPPGPTPTNAGSQRPSGAATSSVSQPAAATYINTERVSYDGDTPLLIQMLGAIRDAWWSVVRRVPGIPPLGLGYQLDPGY